MNESVSEQSSERLHHFFFLQVQPVAILQVRLSLLPPELLQRCFGCSLFHFLWSTKQEGLLLLSLNGSHKEQENNSK